MEELENIILSKVSGAQKDKYLLRLCVAAK